MVTLELAYNVALGRYLKDPKMIWNVSVVANNHVGVDCPYPYGLITQDGTWPMTVSICTDGRRHHALKSMRKASWRSYGDGQTNRCGGCLHATVTGSRSARAWYEGRSSSFTTAPT